MNKTVRDVAVGLAAVAVASIFVKPVVVRQKSMEPTLQEHNYLFLNRQAYTFGEPKRGDIIVFKSNLKDSKGRDKCLVKRVIGLPGERITISNNVVSINGEPLDEDYIMDKDCTPGDIDEYVPDGCLFVMGDNRAASQDSRISEIGKVSMNRVLGTAVFRLFPLRDSGRL